MAQINIPIRICKTTAKVKEAVGRSSGRGEKERRGEGEIERKIEREGEKKREKSVHAPTATRPTTKFLAVRFLKAN